MKRKKDGKLQKRNVKLWRSKQKRNERRQKSKQKRNEKRRKSKWKRTAKQRKSKQRRNERPETKLTRENYLYAFRQVSHQFCFSIAGIQDYFYYRSGCRSKQQHHQCQRNQYRRWPR